LTKEKEEDNKAKEMKEEKVEEDEVG